jgi:hypothetical protein
MSHSQYYPTNVIKADSPPPPSAVPTTMPPSYHTTPYTISHYPSYNYYNNNEYYQKDFGYEQQYQQTYMTLTPPLASPTIIHNFDQISNCSPPSSDYIFNGDFNLFNGTDFDSSFPLIDSTKSAPLFDNQTVEIKQLTPIKIQSFDDEEEKTISALPSVASVNCWKFEPQMTGAY